MSQLPALYSVVLLPSRETVARGLSLRDASAWIRTYNEVMQGRPAQAVIAEEVAAVSARPLRKAP
ncbi:hypothetical protein ETAA8_70530 [Anatilimnocola aggregata]|uniref:Uncharacterized protein n=1 Tax=Anatilimnocola aggregata TaxID=2528021 RepID=A0A517YNU4_9BACT|nr:hypothetical protein [Anatilimnocola aggregata]QDU31891.1 hypothetical protein ETAA8_70530 [Anatilimnocola aggregata]